VRAGPDARAARWIAVRIALLGALLAAGLAAIGWRAVRLQVLDPDGRAEEAQDQYLRELVLRPRRGAVTDRTGVLLAGSADAESVFANPHRLAGLPGGRHAAERLAGALGLDARALAKKLLAREARFVWVKRRVSPSEAAAVRALDLPGVGLVTETKRYYPKGALAAHVLGLVGDDGNGLEGVEYTLDEQLRGEPTRVPSLRDGAGKLVLATAPGTERREGARVELTLDQGLQLATERALAAAVTGSHALSGMAVALDPRTGEVLAMAGWPTFNPNALRPGDVLRNRAVVDPYEPGSTVKTFTIAGALEAGKLKATDAIDCGDGHLAVGAHVIHDHRGLGWTGPSRILAISSNVGAAKIGARLGRGGLHDALAAFGFGERTEIGLPGEARGHLAVPRSDIAVATNSFGQGMTATALQVTAAMAAIADGGVLVKPTLVKRIVDPATGQVLDAAEPTPVRRAVSEAVAAQVTRWLVGVVEDPQGTGRRARLEGWRIAGKTGTGQKADPVSGGYATDRNFSSFVGFAPADAPRIAIGVFVDEPRGETFGGEVAAPAFREIAEYAMKMMGVPPARSVAGPGGAPPGPPPTSTAAEVGPDDGVADGDAVESPVEPAAAREGAVSVPAVLGLPARSAVRALEAADLGADLEGSGRVRSQAPAAGKVVERGARVRLVLAPSG